MNGVKKMNTIMDYIADNYWAEAVLMLALTVLQCLGVFLIFYGLYS